MSVAAVLTAYFAYRGIDAWKKEFVGKREVEVVDKLLRSLYRLRREVSRIRSSAMTREQYPLQGRAVNRAQDNALIRAEHAEALFGKEIREKVQSINFLVNTRLLLRITWFLSGYVREKYEERLEDLNILHEDRDNDPFGRELDEKIEAVEAVVRPYLKF